MVPKTLLGLLNTFFFFFLFLLVKHEDFICIMFQINTQIQLQSKDKKMKSHA